MVDRSQSQPDLTVVALTTKSFSNWLLYGMTEDIHKEVTTMFAYQASHGSMPLRKVAKTNLDVMRRTPREELARDWSAAFALGMSSVTPHESVIRCGLTMQEPRDLTLAWMRRYGVLPDESLAEPYRPSRTATRASRTALCTTSGCDRTTGLFDGRHQSLCRRTFSVVA